MKSYRNFVFMDTGGQVIRLIVVLSIVSIIASAADLETLQYLWYDILVNSFIVGVIFSYLGRRGILGKDLRKFKEENYLRKFENKSEDG